MTKPMNTKPSREEVEFVQACGGYTLIDLKLLSDTQKIKLFMRLLSIAERWVK